MIRKISQIVAFYLYKVFSACLRPKKILLQSVLASRHLIISNHIYALDPFLIISTLKPEEFTHLLPIHTITKNRFLYGTPYGPLLRLIGCFPSKPHGNAHYGIEGALHYAQTSSILIFPQGKVRSTEPPKTGAAVIANTTGLPVLPFYIERRKPGFYKAFVIVRGQPFNATGMDINQMMDKVWELKKHIK